MSRTHKESADSALGEEANTSPKTAQKGHNRGAQRTYVRHKFTPTRVAVTAFDANRGKHTTRTAPACDGRTRISSSGNLKLEKPVRASATIDSPLDETGCHQ